MRVFKIRKLRLISKVSLFLSNKTTAREQAFYKYTQFFNSLVF